MCPMTSQSGDDENYSVGSGLFIAWLAVFLFGFSCATAVTIRFSLHGVMKSDDFPGEVAADVSPEI